MNDSLERLITALENQSEAINRLADSNMALVSIVVEGDGEYLPDDEAPHGRDLSGKPIRVGD
ncbi:hypothetical protein [Stutzerimonas stutzeri]|uniref:hypothetical protein n=1 Tax=Stutzerimonas stutzeri TaxID=316 RepID=UPI001C2E3DC0|nr:hypothetical protein [Stutzerimonas stutzeri]